MKKKTCVQNCQCKQFCFLSQFVPKKHSYAIRRYLSCREFSGPSEYVFTFAKNALSGRKFMQNTKYEGIEKSLVGECDLEVVFISLYQFPTR